MRSPARFADLSVVTVSRIFAAFIIATILAFVLGTRFAQTVAFDCGAALEESRANCNVYLDRAYCRSTHWHTHYLAGTPISRVPMPDCDGEP